MRRVHQPVGFTLIELLVVMAVIAIIAAIAVPLVMRAKLQADEASAISSLRTIHDSQEIFRAACGGGKLFAATLPQLGAAKTITYDLADAPIVAKAGYLITLVGTPPPDQDKDKLDACTGALMAAHWYASARPQSPGRSGQRGFATALDADIWADAKGAPPPEPFQASATISRLEVVR
jgi:prepilin-type N-terminal cleavage/methylation domain-containing protein